jgi:hypothetical protein
MIALGSGLWLNHHQWVKHHRPWLYDEYRAGYAAGLQVPNALEGSDEPCGDATTAAYPRRPRLPASGNHRVIYNSADDTLVFFRACQDGETDVPGGPKHRINEFFYGDD